MPIIYLKRLDEFARNHANARKSLGPWKNVVLQASWKNKQALSLTMIRKFSKLLRIPTDALTKEYKLTK